MTEFSIRTPSRLHFGLLSWGDTCPRCFGGVGLMIDQPGIELSAAPSDHWRAEGPLSERTLRISSTIASGLHTQGYPSPPLAFRIRSAAPEHVGLGTGTQLSLAVARCIAEAVGLSNTSSTRLASWSGRGLRSGIGLHGFERGGLIVDAGRRRSHELDPPALVTRLEMPAEWSILVVIPPSPIGLSGVDESRAFNALPPFPDALIDRLCRLVMLGLIPAVVEHDLTVFGASLDELQHHVGLAFSPAQGGIYAHELLAEVVWWLRRQGLKGVGQSSWGPALYGFLEADDSQQIAVSRDLLKRFKWPPGVCFWTKASNSGALFQIPN